MIVCAAAIGILGLAIGLDGVHYACNESDPAWCTGFHVPWPALLVVLGATVALAVLAAVRWPRGLRGRRYDLLMLFLFAGCVTGCVLVLRSTSEWVS
ncbi:hypothetical protein SAMN06295885_3170 [Rathayibacter oskolensis]|uniref:Uncharacterized protein n=1 Tax=Rathayibacter oskolensis TaxID=1891671 RepID=A0A1X7PD06_9MICO|nr:hypothetical protein [Rathayibacter oskolensis]SMH48988.1 hypothetical protein SAMN06295885_3170 [Rathayibacter oskolensis]